MTFVLPRPPPSKRIRLEEEECNQTAYFGYSEEYYDDDEIYIKEVQFQTILLTAPPPGTPPGNPILVISFEKEIKDENFILPRRRAKRRAKKQRANKKLAK